MKTTQESSAVNRTYKDSLFKILFGREEHKQNAVDLYNAVNGTDYTNLDDLEFNTIEDVVYMKMKNDVSFLFDSKVNLYEAQSTFNPNMPLRGLVYFGQVYGGYLNRDEWNPYGTKQIALPTPKFVVFYNGMQDQPERQLLRLTDAMDHPQESDVEVTCQVLNINYDAGGVILERCRILKEYALLIQRIRGNMAAGMTLLEAADRAVDECIAEHILEDILRKEKGEIMISFLTEYDEEKHIRLEKKESLEEGIAIGKEEGCLNTLKSLVTDGILTIEDAAKRADMTAEEFCEKSGLPFTD